MTTLLRHSPGRSVMYALLACATVLVSGCASNGSGPAHGSMYVGVGYYDSWGWGPCCYYGSPPVVVGPPGNRPDRPDVDRPVRPEHPIAKPPSRPTPAPRPARTGGGGRRR
jgi:hypothetical protein